MYSTSLLRVILRSNPVAFGDWGLIILCSQLHDTNQTVILEAISILDEALEDKVIDFLSINYNTILFMDYLLEISSYILSTMAYICCSEK